MKTRSRPFQVEVRRAKAPSSRPLARTKSAFQQPLLNPLLNEARHQITRNGQSKHLTMRADPVLDRPEASTSIDLGGAPEEGRIPQAQRVLPDLRCPQPPSRMNRRLGTPARR